MELTSARATWFSLSFPPVQPSINHQQGPLFVQRKTRHTRGLLGSTQYRLTSFTKKEVKPHRKTKTNRLTSKQIATRFSNVIFLGFRSKLLFSLENIACEWEKSVVSIDILWPSLTSSRNKPSGETLCEHHAQRAQNDDRLSRERGRSSKRAQNEYRMISYWTHEIWTLDSQSKGKTKQNKQKQNTEKKQKYLNHEFCWKVHEFMI